MSRFLSIAVGWLLAVTTFAGGHPDPNEMIAKITKSQTEALAIFERELPSWQIDYEVKSFGPGNQLQRHAKYTQRYTPAGFAATTETVLTGESGKEKDAVAAKNKQYRFSLSRTPGSSDWALVKVDRLQADTAASKPHRYGGAWFTRHLYTAEGVFYADIIGDKQFVVKSCAPSPANAGWVRVAGEIPAAGKKPGLNGWWDFDPAMSYCCRGSEVISTFQGYSTTNREGFSLSRREAGFITVDSYTFNGHASYSGEIKNQGQGEWTFRYRHDPNVPESEFTLSKYGLPEPHFESLRARAYRWLYLLAGAAVATATAWWLRRRSLRQQPA
jgi:hypothetical protein